LNFAIEESRLSTKTIKESMETFESREFYNKAVANIRKNNYKEASSLIMQALKIAPDNQLYLSSMGLCTAMQGKPTAGRNMCQQAIEMAGLDKDPMLYVNLGRVLLAAGDRENARKNFTLAYKLDNTNAPAALELSRMGVRKKPVLSFLKRDHFLNIRLGKIRHMINEWRNPGLKKE
jgi:Flp pilus assembly protein TadD